jgi:hypothetical protein
MAKSGEERSEQLIEQWAQQISRWRLALPAILLLELAKPFSFVASQGLLLCQPLLGFFYDEAKITGYADFLADRSKLEHLSTRLETLESVRGQYGKEKVR